MASHVVQRGLRPAVSLEGDEVLGGGGRAKARDVDRNALLR